MEDSPKEDGENISEIVQSDLKGEASDDDIKYLEKNPNQWRSELLTMKLSCEAQMVAANARRFQNHQKWIAKEINSKEYHTTLNDEKVWKCSAARFLQQIETKLLHVSKLVSGE